MVPHSQMFMFSFSSTTLIVNFLNSRTGNAFARIYWFANLVIMDSITGNQGGGGETRSGTEKRCSHNLQSGHPAWWSADNCGIFPTVNIFRLFRSKKRAGRGNQKCLKN